MDHERTCCPVIELRRYRLRPGQRDVLVELFERHLYEPQIAVGMSLIGQFQDVGDPDQFVFLRGFRGMDARHEALDAFYNGPVWQEHRTAANATMISSDNVLLLRPARPEWSFPESDGPDDAAAQTPRGGPVVVTIWMLNEPADDELLDLIADRLPPALERVDADLIACLVTESTANTFPALPVREGVNAVVWLTRYRDGHSDHTEDLNLIGEPPGTEVLVDAISQRLVEPRETLILRPTPRSKLRGPVPDQPLRMATGRGRRS